MKTKKFYVPVSIIAILTIILLVMYYSGSKKSIITENYTLNDHIYLSKEDTTLGALTIDLNIELPLLYHDKIILHKIKTIICAELFGNTYVDLPEDSMLHLYAKELGVEYISNNVDFAKRITDDSRLSFNNSIVLEGFALLNDEHIFSYGISRFTDFGGAHPIKNRLFYNFDLNTGDLISEEDIFVVDYMDELTEIIKEQLLKIQVKNEISTLSERLDDSIYYIENIKPNGNFYINDESICYVFNPYEIAPYYIGETEVELPFQKIARLVTPVSPIYYLIETALKKQQ